MSHRHAQLCLFLLAGLALVGCEKGEEQKTLAGANERNAVLKQKVADLEARLARADADYNSRIAALEAAQSKGHEEFDQRLAKLDEVNRREKAVLEAEIASLQLELGSTRREKLVLQEIVDQRPRIHEAVSSRFGVERLVYIGVIVIVCGLLLFVVSRYSALRSRFNGEVLRRAQLVRVEDAQ